MKLIILIFGFLLFNTISSAQEYDFESVQEAIDAVPDFRKQRTTILTNDDFAKKKNRFGEEMGTTGSSSFFVFGDGFRIPFISGHGQPAVLQKLLH